MSLPRNWIDKIFTKLTVTYGRDFASRWEGLDIDAVKDDWAEELTAYQQAPSAIAHALSVLPPEKPPTVLQFRELCSRAPQYAPKALPAPAPTPERLSEALARLAALEKPQTASKAWALRLQERESRSKTGLTKFQRDAWREALKTAPAAEAA